MVSYMKGLLGLTAAVGGVQILTSEPFARMEEQRYQACVTQPIRLEVPAPKGGTGRAEVFVLGFAQYHFRAAAAVERALAAVHPNAMGVSASPEELPALHAVYRLFKAFGHDPHRVATEGLKQLKASRLRENPVFLERLGVIPGYAAAVAVGRAAELQLPCGALDDAKFQKVPGPPSAAYFDTLQTIVQRSVGYDVFGRIQEEFAAAPFLVPCVLSTLFEPQDWAALASTLKQDDPAMYDLRHRQRHQHMAQRLWEVAAEACVEGGPQAEAVRVLAVVTDQHAAELRDALRTVAVAAPPAAAEPEAPKRRGRLHWSPFG